MATEKSANVCVCVLEGARLHLRWSQRSRAAAVGVRLGGVSSGDDRK